MQKGAPVAIAPTLDCLGCHNGSGATAFAFAGYVAGSDGGAPGVTVHLDMLATESDSNGYFWLAGTAAPSGSASVTSGTLPPAKMAEPAPPGCAKTGCHVPGAQGPIHFP
jgi:hypothetical protein